MNPKLWLSLIKRFIVDQALQTKSHQALKPKSLSGLHIVANLSVVENALLLDFQPAKVLFESLVQKFNLQKVGEVYHNFPGGGFTAVVCLTESHLSIHTWPEHSYFTFDIFLSNYLKDNSQTTKEFYLEVVKSFKAIVVEEKFITR
jgi:S-adenosylmethionine decarboxylase